MKAVGSAGIAALWSKVKSGFLPLSGGALSGNLSARYITGLMLRITQSNHSSTAPEKVVVQDSRGWLYHRTPDELRADIGAASTAAATASADGLMSAADKAKLDGISDSGGGGFMADADFIEYVTG